jgi:BMFP domain-containing protein YqiC
MTTLNVDQLAQRFLSGIPEAFGAARHDLEANFRAVLQGAAGQLDLASRSEFDVQARLLERARERITQLESRLGVLEGRLAELQSAFPPVSD